MTIKEFANLCGCNPQTIRYYDRMNLLKPVKVDDWTGYRYYDEEQALDYVKIKNLQTAGFTIEEITSLKDADDEAIYDAFSRKIKEHEEKLKKIIEIQKSYHSEVTDMKTRIEEVRNKIKAYMDDYNPSAEFGIDDSTYDAMKGQVDSFFDNMFSSGDYSKFEYIDDSTDEKREPDFLSDPQYEVVYEKHGWTAVKDFYEEFADLDDNQAVTLCFELVSDKSNTTAFANTILGMLLEKNKGKKMQLGCKTDVSKDGKNHFWLLKKR